MKLTAEVEWVIDDAVLGIESGTTEDVDVDADYVEGNVQDIAEWVENELESKYGTSFKMSLLEDDDGDFVITNMKELIDDLNFEEFNSRTAV